MNITPEFIASIRELIASARTTVARGVDLVQVHTNFEIGRRIVQEEQRGKDRAAYGEQVVRVLAERLTGEFGRGFSLSNLKSMRQFYLQNQHRISQSVTGQLETPSKSQTLSGQFGILQTLSGKLESPAPRPFALSCSHYVFLLGVKNPDERSFNEIEASEQNWTLRELKRQFGSGLYERLALRRDKEGIRRLAQEGQVVGQPTWASRKRSGACSRGSSSTCTSRGLDASALRECKGVAPCPAAEGEPEAPLISLALQKGYISS